MTARIKLKALKAILFILVVIACSYVGYKFIEKPDAATNGKTEASFTTNQLIIEVSNNEGKELKKYIEKEIEIGGEIKEITQRDNIYTLILGGDKDKVFIICEMQVEEELKIKKLKVGQSVKIKGVYKGVLRDAILLNCRIV